MYMCAKGVLVKQDVRGGSTTQAKKTRVPKVSPRRGYLGRGTWESEIAKRGRGQEKNRY